jgi:hypothetical protein
LKLQQQNKKLKLKNEKMDLQMIDIKIVKEKKRGKI